jgi:hypothetical protein
VILMGSCPVSPATPKEFSTAQHMITIMPPLISTHAFLLLLTVITGNSHHHAAPPRSLFDGGAHRFRLRRRDERGQFKEGLDDDPILFNS